MPAAASRPPPTWPTARGLRPRWAGTRTRSTRTPRTPPTPEPSASTSFEPSTPASSHRDPADRVPLAVRRPAVPAGPPAVPCLRRADRTAQVGVEWLCRIGNALRVAGHEPLLRVLVRNAL